MTYTYCRAETIVETINHDFNPRLHEAPRSDCRLHLVVTRGQHTTRKEDD